MVMRYKFALILDPFNPFIHMSSLQIFLHSVHSLQILDEQNTGTRNEISWVGESPAAVWKAYRDSNTSAVDNTFSGQLQITKTCPNCLSVNTTFEMFRQLILPFILPLIEPLIPYAATPCVDLNDCLLAYQEPEVLYVS